MPGITGISPPCAPVSPSSGSRFPTRRKPGGLHSCRPGMTIYFIKIFNHFLSHMWSSHEPTLMYTLLAELHLSLVLEKCTFRSKPGIPNSPMQKREPPVLPENCVKNSIPFSMALGKDHGNRITCYILLFWFCDIWVVSLLGGICIQLEEQDCWWLWKEVLKCPSLLIYLFRDQESETGAVLPHRTVLYIVGTFSDIKINTAKPGE